MTNRKSEKMMKVLFFGDVVGRPGRSAVKRFLDEEKDAIRPDLIIANTDNLSSGRGPTIAKCDEMLEMGIDVLTCGDHIWDQKEIIEYLSARDSRLIRPANYPDGVPGRGSIEVEAKGQKVTICNLLGRTWTTEGLDSPFVKADGWSEDLQGKITIVDLHAEATSEQIAFGRNFAGKFSAIVGTHTHVQTADEEIIDGHTAYISDVGFCGPHESVIGLDPKCSIKRFRTGLPLEFELAPGPTQVNAVIIEIDEKSGKALKIERIQRIYE
jgi:hypothetical protein